jgi:protease-4
MLDHKDPAGKEFDDVVDGVDALVAKGLVDKISAVATGRHMDEAKVKTLADGRVYSGEQALQLGLVDQLGNFQDAISLAAEKAGITGEPQLIRAEGKRRVWWQRLLSEWLGEELWGEGSGVLLLYLGPQLS